jgi:hypothetical protein
MAAQKQQAKSHLRLPLSFWNSFAYPISHSAVAVYTQLIAMPHSYFFD